MGIIHPNTAEAPLDYSKDDFWMVKQNGSDAKVDVFYFYPTASNPRCRKPIADIDLYMQLLALESYKRGPECFKGFANIYAPYYRQLALPAILRTKDAYEFTSVLARTTVMADAFAALDYYFENYNAGRPFILASHSQGTAVANLILREYMSIHPDCYERMIAGYLLGFAFEKDFAQKYPHVRFAEDETDTGVVITWNTEGPGATMPNHPLAHDAHCGINPLNWKTDDTYAGVELNRGSYNANTHTVGPGFADARIDLQRCALVTTTPPNFGCEPIPKDLQLFGDNSYHLDDWSFFYSNIRQNAQKRTAAFLSL